MLHGARAAGGNHRHPNPVGHRRGQLQIIPVFGAVAIHAGEQNLARTQLDAAADPFQHIQSGVQPSALFIHIPARAVLPPSGVHRQHHALAAEPRRRFGDQLRSIDRSGVDRNFIRALAQHLAKILHRADAAAHRKGDGQLFRHPRRQIHYRGTFFMGGGDVQKYHLVRARFGIGGRNLDRIAGIAQVHKIDPFDHSPIANVQTGYDAFGIHQCSSSPAMAAKLRSRRSPTRPDFSGWNCTPITLPRCTAA